MEMVISGDGYLLAVVSGVFVGHRCRSNDFWKIDLDEPGDAPTGVAENYSGGGRLSLLIFIGTFPVAFGSS